MQKLVSRLHMPVDAPIDISKHPGLFQVRTRVFDRIQQWLLV